MPTPINPRENQTTYVINPEDATETGRLLLQDRTLTKEMGGVLPSGFELLPGQIVLDLACGPGGWVLDVAHAYPNIEVIGVDISHKMIRYGQAQAQVLGLDNANFQVMNILNGLEFPNDAFDFVNARLISSFMPKDAWPSFMQECLRITRAGGTLRLTEGEVHFTSSEGSEKLADMMIRAMWLDGKTFSPNGKRIGITLMLGQFLHEAGLTNIQHQAYALEYSSSTEGYETWYQNLMMAYSLVAPYLQKKGVITQEEFDSLYKQVEAEMQNPEFRSLTFLLSTWGTKAVLSS